MKYACLVYNNPNDTASITDADLDRMIANWDVWMSELEKLGKHVFSSGLQSTVTATTLRKCNGQVAISDGPFAETKEILGGFTIIEARDLNEALIHAKKLAEICGGTVEVRPQFDPFADLIDPMDKRCAAAFKRTIEKAESQ